MDEGRLPDNVIRLSAFKISYDKKQKCEHGSYEVDVANKEVLCRKCGAVVQPWDALLDVARHHEKFDRETERILEQRKQIENYKPHLLDVRRIEQIYRGRDMIPCCPHCHRGIFARELAIEQVNKQVELEMRKFEKKE